MLMRLLWCCKRNVMGIRRDVPGQGVIAKENQQDDSSGATNLPLL